MQYLETVVHKGASSRFGELVTGSGKYSMPVCSPALRTKADVKAVIKNINSGIRKISLRGLLPLLL